MLDGPDIARETAMAMAQVMDGRVQYINGLPYVNKEGMSMLIDLFDKVPDELKAASFECFLDELEKRDIDYNMDQFMGTA